MAAEVEISPSFGAEIKDGFKPINAWVSGGIQWLDDVQQFYRERSLIEKEYAGKLSALAKKYYERKAKKSSVLSVGDTPTVTPGSLESASMTTWATQLSTLEKRAEEHDRFATALVSALADPVRNLAARSEDLRKQHAEYAGKLEKERDTSYADLKKAKTKYDSICQEVENRRKKAESGFDKTKAQGQYQQQLAEMRNSKNSYLIAINVTNKQKEKYYHEYVPELLDSLQTLSESRISTLNNLWLAAANIENKTMTNSIQLLDHLSTEIPRNNPALDSMMFVRHNTPQWQDPSDFAFEPSPVWLDDSAIATDPASKTFLMNILSKSKASLTELKRTCDTNRKEVEGAKRARQAIREGKDKRDEVEIVRAQLHHQELLHEAERKLVTAEVEVFTITASVGDVTRGARNHTFRNQTFKIPTNCDLCGDRIWGLSAKGLSCEECGFTCHTKCELKVPADCPGELNKEQKKSIKAERQAAAQAAAATPVVVAEEVNGAGGGGGGGGGGHPSLARTDTLGSMNTLSSGYAASAQRSVSGATTRSTLTDEGGGGSSGALASAPPTTTTSTSTSSAPVRRRIAAPPPTSYRPPSAAADDDDLDSPQQKGRMLYAYTATSEGEVSVPEGQEFTLLDPDDGSGWIKIKPASFGAPAGLVPAAYAEISATPTSASGGGGLALPRPISTASASTTSLAGSDSGSAAASSSSKPKKQGPAVAPRRGAKKVKHVEALYTYSASGPGEADMQAGERLVLVTPDQGDGWCEVEAAGGKGIVPASWVREV